MSPRSPRGARPRAVAVFAVIAALAGGTAGLAGCGDTDDSPAEARSWPEPGTLDDRGLVYASDVDVIHLGDGSTVEVDLPGPEPEPSSDPASSATGIASFVVAGGAAYVEPATDGDEEPALLRVTAEGTETLDVHPYRRSLRVSPDGRYLAFIDVPPGGRPGAAVVVDLREGREVARTSTGLGERGDDIRDLYSELHPGIAGFSDRAAYVLTTEGVLTLDLRTGAEKEVHEDVDLDSATQRRVFADLVTTDHASNPAGTWRIEPAGRGENTPGRLVADDGTAVTPDLTVADLVPDPLGRRVVEAWALDSWLDDTTAIGRATVTDRLLDDTQVYLVTCTVPAGRCSGVEGAATDPLLPGGGGVTVRRTATPTPASPTTP